MTTPTFMITDVTNYTSDGFKPMSPIQDWTLPSFVSYSPKVPSKTFMMGKMSYKTLKDLADSKQYLVELYEENEGEYKEEIVILKNQIHSSGKKPKLPKMPELDWNKKVELIQRHVSEYYWKDLIQELESLFSDRCLHRWEGVQKVYEKQKPQSGNVIQFPVGEG